MATKPKNGTPTALVKTAPPTNGGLVFERLGKDFQLPTVQKTSMWEPVLKQLQDAKGEVCVVFRAPYAKARATYAKAKALQGIGERSGIKDLSVAVRKMNDEAVILAGIGVAGDEADE